MSEVEQLMAAASVTARPNPGEITRVGKATELLKSRGASEELILRWIDALVEAEEDPGYRSWFTKRFNSCLLSGNLEAVTSREEYERASVELNCDRLLAAGVPRVYVDMNYEDVTPRPNVSGFTEALEGAKSYSAGIASNLANGKGLTFAGDPGTGKTMLTALTLKAAADADILFIRARSLFEGLKPGDNAESLRRRLYTVALLAIDDLGGEYRTEWTMCEFDALVSERHAEERSTIFTTNYYPGELAKVYAPRVLDRLREVNRIYEIKGKSYRKEK